VTPSQPAKPTSESGGRLSLYAVSELTQLHSNSISTIPSFLLEVFDAARHARPIAHAAYSFIVRAKLSNMRLGSKGARCKIELDAGKSRMRGEYGERKVFVMFVFLLLAGESGEGE